MNTNLNNLSKQNGFTLLDAVLWFAIFAIGAGVIYSKFSSTLGSSKSQNEKDAIILAISQTKKAFAGGASGTTGDITSFLTAKKGVFTRPMTVSGTSVVNGFGGSVSVIDNGATFTLSSGNYPNDICIDVAQSTGDFTSASVNGSTLTIPVTLQDATGACTSGSNTISFTTVK